MDEQVYFTAERREANMKIVVDRLREVKELDFNSLIFAFVDLIQSSFLNGLLVGRSKEERDELNAEVIAYNNLIIDTLNKENKNKMIDMIVLSNLMMEAIEDSMQKALADSKSK